MKARNTGSEISFEPAPTGMHVARCVRVIDLGTAMDDFWQKEKHEIFVMWELPEEIKTYTVKGENGQPDKEVVEPFSVSKFYTLSLGDKAHLRNDLESWRGKPFTEDELNGFEMNRILGSSAMVNVIHTPKKKGSGVTVVVKSVTGLPKSMVCPEAVHDLQYFSLEDYDATVFEALSKGIKARVMRSNEYQSILAAEQGRPAPEQTNTDAAASAAAPADDDFDDLPF